MRGVRAKGARVRKTVARLAALAAALIVAISGLSGQNSGTRAGGGGPGGYAYPSRPPADPAVVAGKAASGHGGVLVFHLFSEIAVCHRKSSLPSFIVDLR